MSAKSGIHEKEEHAFLAQNRDSRDLRKKYKVALFLLFLLGSFESRKVEVVLYMRLLRFDNFLVFIIALSLTVLQAN